MSQLPTPSQTVGPFFAIGLNYCNSDSLYTTGAPGDPIEITGQLFDGEGTPIPDAVLELWQADPHGRFVDADTGTNAAPDPNFLGFARTAVDEHGGFRIRTIMPGPIAANGVEQAPHIVVLIFMRGLLKHLYTRIYFGGDARNASDAVLSAVPAERRATLIAQRSSAAPGQYTWNIRMQGDEETVFFQY